MSNIINAIIMEIHRNIMKGKFIVLEGIDKSGKTTLSQSLFSRIGAMNMDVVLTHEPTEHIDDGLGILDKLDRDDYFILTAMFLRDRIAHNRMIEDDLKRNRIVICDRYSLSTMAYQGVFFRQRFENDDRFYQWMESTLSISHIQPDLTIFIDFDAEMFMNRNTSHGKLKMFEKEEYLRSVYAIYMQSIERKILSREFLIIPGNMSREDMEETALRKIMEL
ncbi:MAG: dTMP kinase [Candidatus Thermoplasmatota archaeon]|jgi:dTMP kinase|nr:dTMP kinase [Candidatus Thermoplasmatota archaeon]MCL5790578.1 dTMP kinase [Candidatus Thermoplasmatota archaeon]